MIDKEHKIQELAYKIFQRRGNNPGTAQQDHDLASILVELQENGVRQQKMSADAEYTRISVHLDYLDEKIFKFLSLYCQIAIAFIGGAFFLSTIELTWPWAWLIADVLMSIVSFGGILFIVHHLFAWKGYRDELTAIFIPNKPKGRYWWGSETVQCILIGITCFGFWIFNPLSPWIYDDIHGPKSTVVRSTNVSEPPPVQAASAGQGETPPVALDVKPSPFNSIRNGLFNYPLSSRDSGWGTGQYSARFLEPGLLGRKQYWLNFGGADIDASIETTQKGNALKIVNRSGSQPNVVGIMEQLINVTPGIYELSFLAKGDDLEPSSLQITTTTDWRITDPNGTRRGIDLTEGGSFDWKKISDKIKIDVNGPITLSVTSKGKGTLYITGFELRRIAPPP